MKAIYSALALVFILSGCAAERKSFDYRVDLSTISPAYDTMMERYGVVKSVAESKWDKFTETEQRTLNLVSNYVRLIENRVDRLRNKNLDNIDGCRVTVPELGYIYTLARDAYDMSRGVAMNHIGDFTASEILTLQNFDFQLQEIDAEIKALTLSPQISDANHLLTGMLNLSSAALKIILPVVLGRELYAGQE